MDGHSSIVGRGTSKNNKRWMNELANKLEGLDSPSSVPGVMSLGKNPVRLVSKEVP